MEAIRLYLDSVFAQAPDTGEMRRIKGEMLDNMEEKYHELKADGVSENEAIGAVISDFGNVEELFAELGIATNAAANPATTGTNSGITCPTEVSKNSATSKLYPTLTSEQADSLIDAYASSARGISLGVLLATLGVIQLIAVNAALADLGTWVGAVSVSLLLLIAIPAVGLFIINGTKISRFRNIDNGHFRLDAGMRARLKLDAENKRRNYPAKTIFAISLPLIGVICLIMSSYLQSELEGRTVIGLPLSVIGFLILLFAAAITASIFIIMGMEHTSYDKLLQRGDYTPAGRKADRLTDMIASVYWPLTVVIYLAWSFITHDWHITWIVWPVAAVLFGGIASFIPEFKKAKEDDDWT